MDISRQRGFVLLLLIARLAPSSLAISNRPNTEQKPWDRMHITQAPRKRDATACPTDYSSCPASLSGGCCPNDRSCGTDSCYATTAAPANACSKSGYIACGIDEGGGCCPGGYSCANDGCIPLSGVTDTQTCGIGSISCAASLGGGCCKTHYACGENNICYQTSFSSVPFTQTITTTDSNAHTITVTTSYLTAYRETYTPVLSTATPSAAVAKVTTDPTAVPKVDPSATSSGGLTKGQLGGIIAAAVIILLAVFVAAFLIIRRLNAVVKVQQSATRNSGSGTHTRSSDRHKPRKPPSSTAGIDYDTLSIDPLMIPEDSQSSTRASSARVRLSRPSAVHNNRSELDSASAASSPPIPEPYGSPSSTNFGSGYQQVPSAEPNYFDTPVSNNHNRLRNRSIDSDGQSNIVSPHIGTYGPSSTYGSGGEGYFDPLDPALRDQNLRFGHPPARPVAHGRQWSDASDVSAQSAGDGGLQLTPPVELEGGAVEERMREGSVGSMASVMQRMGLSRSSRRHSEEGRRRSSSGGTGSSIGIGRRISGAPQGGTGVYPSQAQRLDRVQEASHIALDNLVGKAKDEVVVSQEEVASASRRQRRDERLGIEPVPPLERELQRLDGQKFGGDMHNLLGKK